MSSLFFFQAEDGIRDKLVTGVQTCALPIWALDRVRPARHPLHRGRRHRAGHLARRAAGVRRGGRERSEEHTSELQSLAYLVCRLLLEKKKTTLMIVPLMAVVIAT